MESWKTKRIPLETICLAVMILMTYSFGNSEGFFLKNIASEATTEEYKISTTPSADTLSSDSHPTTHDEIHRNNSEKLEESSTHIVNTVKDIVSLVLDQHTTTKDTQLSAFPEEDNQIDIDLRNLSPNGDNDIPAPEARHSDKDIPTPDVHLTDLEHDTNEPIVSIVKIPEANSEDIATALEDNIRNSVKDEIQLEQNLESSAIDDIPDLEVRQTLTEDLRAMEYPQSVKKLDDPGVDSNPTFVNETSAMNVTEGVPNSEVHNTPNEDSEAVKELEGSSVESKTSVVKEEGEISSTVATSPTIANEPNHTPDNVPEKELQADSVETTSTTVPNIETTTSTNGSLQNIAKIEDVSDQIHPDDVKTTENSQGLKKLDDLDVASNYTQDIIVTQRHDNSEEELKADSVETTPTTVSNIEMSTLTNEVLQQITLIPTEEIVHNLDDMQDTSSSLETIPVLTRHIRDFNEDSNTNEVLTDSQDSSKDTKSSNSKSIDSSESFNSSDSSSSKSSKESLSMKDENVASEETSEETEEAISQDASIEESAEAENVIPVQSVSIKKVSPTPRPRIAAVTTTVVPTETANTDTVLVQEITESTGDILNEVSSTIGESKHVVIKKPGVDEEIATEIPIVNQVENEMHETPIETVINDEPELEARAKAIDVEETEVSEPPAHKMNDTHALITENSLLETEDPLIQSEDQNAPQYTNLDGIPLENPSKTLTEVHDNNTEDVLVSEQEDTPIEHTSVNTSTPEVNQPIDEVKHEGTEKNISSQTLTTSTSVSANPEVYQPIDGEKHEDTDQQTSSPTLTTSTADYASTPEVDHPLSAIDEVKHEDTDQQTLPTSTLSAEPSSIVETYQQSNSSPLLRTLNTDEPSQVDSMEKTVDTLQAVPQTPLVTDSHVSGETLAENEEDVETSTETPSSIFHTVEPIEEVNAFSNEISKTLEDSLLMETPLKNLEDVHHEDNNYETSTEKPTGRSNDEVTSPALVTTLIEAAELTTEFARTLDSFRATRDETAAISDEVISPTAAGRSFNAIIAEGLGKPLPTRSVSDQPSTSSYSSEDKTTTVVVLCSSAAVIFTAFSIAIYLITFQRQHGTLDIEMQEQRCGKDDLEDEEDAETRVNLLNEFPQVDSDENNSD